MKLPTRPGQRRQTLPAPQAVLFAILLATLTACMADAPPPANPPYVSPPGTDRNWLVPDLKSDLDRGTISPEQYEQQKADALPPRR